jgi:hypothetical protein
MVATRFGYKSQHQAKFWLDDGFLLPKHADKILKYCQFAD